MGGVSLIRLLKSVLCRGVVFGGRGQSYKMGTTVLCRGVVFGGRGQSYKMGTTVKPFFFSFVLGF